ncbi:hypothetical protein LWI29_008834 [Acer saccharum]|uniref:Chromo domain-containing protein n=1 Tax=Acer saccharum TaxID=4024 RepID=A0AA39RYY5_ACESA|nr:hypothetical protein LWI29_008834 [Acer saccharum]
MRMWKKDLSRGATTSYEKVAELIMANCTVVGRPSYPPRRENLVKWKGLPECEASWEPESVLCRFNPKIRWFWQEGEEHD